MTCSSCGKTWEEDAAFCIYCGAKKEGQHAKEETQKEMAATTAATDGSNAAVSFGKDYLSFAKNSLLTPTQTSTRVTAQEWIFGIVSLLLFILLLPLTTFTYISKISMGMVQVSFGSGVLQPIFVLLILFAILLGIMFGGLTLMHSNTTFQKLIATYGSLMTAGAALLVASLLLALINVISLSVILLMISLSVAGTAVVTSYFHLNKVHRGLDPFYASLSTFFVMAAVSYFIAESIVREMLSQVGWMNFFF
ncbi:zinc ribbon domain-containing protein [Salibacterium aidingense]|uniref:zinc ribbon domain-containing protein n=1 Tax=Salibacterium aidingense TaxID=384933 RepID=UPI003BE4682D